MIHAQTGPGDVTQTFIDRGVLGAVVIVLAWVTWRLITREAARADDLQQRLDDLNEAIRGDLLPAVLRATEAQARVADLLTKVADLLPDVTSALRDRVRR